MRDPRERAGQAADEASLHGASAISRYATGGGGVTFERKVDADYLAHLFTRRGAARVGGKELGEGRSVRESRSSRRPSTRADDLAMRRGFLGNLSHRCFPPS
jgi:hypothetical protein